MINALSIDEGFCEVLKERRNTLNQKGDSPMLTLHVRIPVKLMEWADMESERCGIARSELCRLALEYIRENQIVLATKRTFKDV